MKTLISIFGGILTGFIVSLIISNDRDGKVVSVRPCIIVAEDTLYYEDDGTITFEDYSKMVKYAYIYGNIY